MARQLLFCESLFFERKLPTFGNRLVYNKTLMLAKTSAAAFGSYKAAQ
jgi:hypothetical protein